MYKEEDIKQLAKDYNLEEYPEFVKKVLEKSLNFAKQLLENAKVSYVQEENYNEKQRKWFTTSQKVISSVIRNERFSVYEEIGEPIKLSEMDIFNKKAEIIKTPALKNRLNDIFEYENKKYQIKDIHVRCKKYPVLAICLDVKNGKYIGYKFTKDLKIRR